MEELSIILVIFVCRSAQTAIQKVQTHQQALLRFIACTEIMLMPAVVLMMLRYVWHRLKRLCWGKIPASDMTLKYDITLDEMAISDIKIS